MSDYTQPPLIAHDEHPNPVAPTPIIPRRRAPRRKVHDARTHGIPAMKLCRDCEQVKPSTEFTHSRSRRDGLNHYCKACSRARGRARYQKASSDYKQRRVEAAYARKLKAQYNLTVEAYQERLAAQGGVCLICQRPPEDEVFNNKRLCVDHDHETGKVRGLLCNSCNAAIGRMRDDPERLRRAIAYLSDQQ